MKPTTEEIVKSLRGCSADVMDCKNCVAEWGRKYGYCFNSLRLYAADRLEELEKELADERYRHDRLQDFCVAQGEELSKLKAQQRWIPVTERLPEDEGEKFIKYGFVHDGELNDRRFMSAGCYYLHDAVPHWINEGYAGMKVTHWMEPPKE